MNQIREIVLNLDSDSSRYTIASAIEIRAKYIRQTSSMDCFAIAELLIKPHKNKTIAVFNNQISKIDEGNRILYPQENSDLDTLTTLNTITDGIIAGITKACLNLEQKSYLVAGIEVSANYAMYHPVDSRSLCYENATYFTLLEVFESVDLIRI